MTEINGYVTQRLFELADIAYKDFHSKLVPSVEPDVIIGVRTPALRKLASELWKQGIADDFIKTLPHKYYEEYNLHGFFIEKIKDFDTVINQLDIFLPYVDNWATCDFINPKVFKNNTDRLYAKCSDWIKSDETYTVRFGIKMLMSYFLDDKFNEEVLRIVSEVKSDEYYINMMKAWFFATALAKQYDSAIVYLTENILDDFTHNKAIQKSIESCRITSEQKDYLRKLKRKKV